VTILVTGAGGKTGKAVVRALAARGARVRVLASRPDLAAELKALGAAEIGIGRFDDASALSRAAAGAQAIYHICPNVSRHEIAYAKAVADAARAQNVRRFAFHSVLHPQIEAMPHHWQKMRAEEFLFTAGFDLTILQPAAYMQNVLAAWPAVIAEGKFRVPYPLETQLSLVDLDDVAEAAALVLTADGHAGATYEIVGTPPMSQTDVAAAIAKALGRNVFAEAESAAAWEARALAGGMGDYERTTLAAMFRYYAVHGLAGNPGVLHHLLRRPPNNLGAFLERVMSARGPG
jgi:NAD(P)H dehydrogenase (quinone)